jgi:hypothetical protein
MRHTHQRRPRGSPYLAVILATGMIALAVAFVACESARTEPNRASPGTHEARNTPPPLDASAGTDATIDRHETAPDTPGPAPVVTRGKDTTETTAHDPGKPFDLQGFIDGEMAAGKKRIVIPPGRHRVTPTNRVHLRFTDVSDVEIVAADAEMICTETTRAVSISNCRNLTIRGLTIDYDPLPYTQGTIVALSANNTVHDIELFDGYPSAEAVRESKYEIFRPNTRTLRFGSYHHFSVEKTGPRRIRVTRTGPYHGEKVGDIIAIGAGRGIPHAITVNDSTDTVLEDVTLYASNCFGFLEGRCTRTTYRRCRIDRRPLEHDLKIRADARIRSLNADAYHSKHAIVGPQLIGCTARFQGDDCVNICGDYHMVMAADGAKLRVLAKRRLDIEEGDPLEVVTYEGRRLPDATAVSTREVGTIAADEGAFLAKQHMHAPFKRGEIDRIFEVVIDRPVDLPRGSIICAANRIGNGFKVVDCDFGFNRSRGILIKASHGEVRGNTLEGCQGQAIKVAPEFWWLEAGSSNDVKIAGNIIRNCAGDGIAVYAIAGKGGMAPAGAHNDIVITGNVIENVAKRHIYVTSTKGLTLQRNTCDAEKVELETCQDVTRD